MCRKMIVLNEKTFAEDCIKNGKKIDGNPFQILAIMAKYYYHTLGYRKKKIVENLTEFLEENYPRYQSNKTSWDESIDKISRNAGRYPLYEIDGVWITKQELDLISALKDDKLERIAFTYLCLAKLHNARNPSVNGWVNEEMNEIYELARVTCNRFQKNVYIGMLHDAGLLEFPKRLDNLSCRVTFINEDGESVLFVSDFRELGYEYEKFKGHDYIRCSECGILMKNNRAKNKRYCDKCAGYQSIGTKTVTCVDCGKEFEVDARSYKKIRCNECQHEIDSKNARIRKQRQREKLNMSR